MIRPSNLVLVWHNNAAYLAIKVPICRIRFVILESSSNLTWHLGLHHENCHGKTTTWRSMTLSENLNAPGLGVRMALGAMPSSLTLPVTEHTGQISWPGASCLAR